MIQAHHHLQIGNTAEKLNLCAFVVVVAFVVLLNLRKLVARQKQWSRESILFIGRWGGGQVIEMATAKRGLDV